MSEEEIEVYKIIKESDQDGINIQRLKSWLSSIDKKAIDNVVKSLES